eukprot:TRINITY_DN4872_c0_g1_i1.p1 TRINITY_DN4872_c0_g1~~TRINITY_DN4872_c0_g1_i1.p1  ORF type:complete len:629 (-),score=208.04 TRINITY_DN4872_c0_g1_i1:4-1890(-)
MSQENERKTNTISLEKFASREISEDSPLNRALGEKKHRNRYKSAREPSERPKGRDALDVPLGEDRRSSSRPSHHKPNKRRERDEPENVTISFVNDSIPKRNKTGRELSAKDKLMRPLSDTQREKGRYGTAEDKSAGFEENKERDEEIAKLFEEKFLNHNRQIEVPPQEASKLINQYGNKPLASGIAHLIASRNLGFPLKKYFIGNPDEMFDNLRKNHIDYMEDTEYDIPSLVCETSQLKPFYYKEKPTVIPAQKSDYDRMNVLSDYFQELVRVSSVAGYIEEPVINHWKNPELSRVWIAEFLFRKCNPISSDMDIESNEQNKQEEENKEDLDIGEETTATRAAKKINFSTIKKSLASTGSGWINTYELREFLAISVLSEPSAFKASVAHSIIKFFKGKRVLDFCSGWGDRLLGALANENPPTDEMEQTNDFGYYVGTDPNKHLFEGYNSMIQRFAKDPSKFTMINEPFETAQLPEGRKTFDLIFTGPPYFDYERYGGEENEGQSTKSFPTLEDWVWNFLLASIDKAWSMLEEGGTMAINISDTNSGARAGLYYTELMNLYIQRNHRDAVYEGVISFVGANMKLPRPIWIYKKQASAFEGNFDRKKTCGNLMSKHYPLIYDKVLRSSED